MRACADWRGLKALLQRWQGLGKLRRLAASLAVKAAPAVAAAAGSGGPARASSGGRKRCSRGWELWLGGDDDEEDWVVEGEEQVGPDTTEQEPQPAAGAAAAVHAPAAQQHGAEAVGRQLRVWLQLGDDVAQQHDGCIAEFTPTGWVALPGWDASCSAAASRARLRTAGCGAWARAQLGESGATVCHPLSLV